MNTKLHLLILLTTACLPVHHAAAVETPPETENSVLYIQDSASYGDGGPISEAAKNECGLDKSIPKAIEKFSPKFNIKTVLSNGTALPSGQKEVATRIDTLISGKAGNGFGGRWVVSEVGVTVSIKQGGQTLQSTYLNCTAGLGANPFANFRACDRLERCSEQIGVKAAKWLSRNGDKAAPQSQSAEPVQYNYDLPPSTR
jgi:hypothetical protein